MAKSNMWKWLLHWQTVLGIATFIFSICLGAGLQVTGWTNVHVGIWIMVAGTIVSVVLIGYAWRKYKPVGEIKPLEGVKYSLKEQAHKELANLIELGQKLWDIKELVQKGDAPFENEKIQKILADFQKERNLPENARIGDSMLEEKFDALVSLYMKITKFDFPHNPEVLTGINGLQTTIRQYINKSIKD